MNNQTWQEEHEQRKAAILGLLETHGITVSSEFVPWSKSRSYKKNHKVSDLNLNYLVTVLKSGREILTADYSMGIGHAPSYENHDVKAHGNKMSILHEQYLTQECETGRKAERFSRLKGKAILPDPLDVLHSLMLDAGAIDHPTYEDFASDFGYDCDSRRGEMIYLACLETGLRLRAGLGEAFEELREAFQDY